VRTRIGNAIFVENQDFHQLMVAYPDQDNDERIRQGYNENKDFYLIKHQKNGLYGVKRFIGMTNL
jgi:hypothetical protein